MRYRGRSIPLGSVAAVLVLAGAAKAQDASFGCKVLLCAAATAPGWSRIPYCVPVMEQLFSDLRRSRAWPTCAEATIGSTSPGISQGWLLERRVMASHAAKPASSQTRTG